MLSSIVELQNSERSSSLDPTSSWIALESKKHSRPTVSLLTPPTSLTDTASISSASTIKDNGPNAENRRVSRVRTAVPSYNESTLSGTSRKVSRKKSCTNAVGSFSGDILTSDAEGVQKQLLQDSIEVLNPHWPVDATMGDKVLSTQSEKSTSDTKGTKVLRQAITVLKQSKSILGKRQRDTVEAVGKLQALGKRTSLRLRPCTHINEVTPVFPERKKARLATTIAEKRRGSEIDTTRNSIKCRMKKQWLSQGLYVGQDPDFDPRLSDAKNRIKRALYGAQPISRRKTLPMPMFAGKRVLEQGRNFQLPWDVFSPLPPGQPKPEEWRKTQKNVFVGDAADIWKTSKKLEHSTCICTKESGCDENCFNRFMFYECEDSNCNIGSEFCKNRSFEDLRKRCKAGGKYNIGVDVIKTADRGYGVRSNRTFEPNQIIVEYTGEIITQDECDDRMRKRYKNNECFYLMVFDQNMIIDATRGSIARFVNHSCEPNCRMVKWTVTGKPRMALFAGERGIMTGEELTYDYNFDPFSSKNIQECHCGTPSCRGVLGPKPKERETKDTLKPSIQVGTKRKLQQAIGDTMQPIEKKRKVPGSKLVKNTIKSLKARASAQLTQGIDESRSAKLKKNISEQLSRERRRAQVRKRKTTVSRTRSRRGGSGAKAQCEPSKDPVKARESTRKAAMSVQGNVVRSVGGTAGVSRLGKSIRIES